MADVTVDNGEGTVTPAWILKASKGELEEIAKEYNLEVTAKSSKDEIQLMLLEHLSFLSREVAESEPSSPGSENVALSPTPSVDDLKLKELELTEKRMQLEWEREKDAREREERNAERERQERREREDREEKRLEREALERREEQDREERRAREEREREALERREREDREERRIERDERREREAFERAEHERQREHEVRMRELGREVRGARHDDDDESINLGKYQGVPKFSEEAVDEFFQTFERQGESLRWPRSRWPVIVGGAISGKAQVVYNTLPKEEAADYDILKAEILKRYALTPAAYRQQYMKCRKTDKQTFKEFAAELKTAHEKWLRSSGAGDEVGTKGIGLELMERFQRAIPSNVRMYLQERKANDLFEAATLADNYQLIHEQEQGRKKWNNDPRPVVKAERMDRPVPKVQNGRQDRQNAVRGSMTCYKCGKMGHIAKNCWVRDPRAEARGRIAVIGVQSAKEVRAECSPLKVVGGDFEPFTSKGEIRVGKTVISVVVFRDTGASLTVVKSSVLSGLGETFTGKRVLISGIEGLARVVPLHRVELRTREYTGEACVGLCDELPIPDVDILVGNDLAGGEVASVAPSGTAAMVSGKEMGLTEVKDTPVGAESEKQRREKRSPRGSRLGGVPPDPIVTDFPEEMEGDIGNPYSVGVLTRSARRKLSAPSVDLQSTFMCPPDRDESEGKGDVLVGSLRDEPMGVMVTPGEAAGRDGGRRLSASMGKSLRDEPMGVRVAPGETAGRGSGKELSASVLGSPQDKPIGPEKVPDEATEQSSDAFLLIKEQQEDESLASLYAEAEEEVDGDETPGVFLRKGLLMRRSRPPRVPASDTWKVDHQVVVPRGRREQLVDLAHNSHLAGHLGFYKTHEKVKRHFFWPGMTKDIRRKCKMCPVCQRSGKKGQDEPKVKLRPIPVVEEPFSRVVLDCVGPLPRSKKGYQYLLTIMCMTTRYVEAIPLRNITTRSVVEAMVKFFTTFGLPREVQTDRGTNFMSGVFAQALKDLGVKHVVSSPYHPQSQGALERFHHTLKEMLRCYCDGEPRDWPGGVPFVLFAVRDSVQESLGFTPFELVFGHDVRGPMKVVKEQWMNDRGRQESAATYVSEMKERLGKAVRCANEHLGEVKERMKTRYDRKARDREYKPGEKVLMLLPSLQNPLTARYVGPYQVRKRVGDVTYVIDTPHGRKKTKLCHANMLKKYHGSDSGSGERSLPIGAIVQDESENEERLWEQKMERKWAVDPGLSNSECYANLDGKLMHLERKKRDQLKRLLGKYKSLFTDVPRRTGKIAHDLELLREETKPIKQHAYRVDVKKREILRREVQFLLQNDLIEPSCSAWSSPCVLVAKSDGGWRMCTDYRKVNAVTRSDSYPIPRIDDCIDSVGQAKFVTKVDLLKGYYGIPLTEKAKDMSAFVTPDGLFQYKVLPFGLKGAPATFQRLMNTVLRDIPNCQAYLDDVIVYSSTWEEHMVRLESLFRRLDETNLTVNLVKSEFGQATVNYLGYEVGSGEVKTQREKVKAIAEMSIPVNRKGVRRFLGMVGYYRKFCCNFAEVALPLTDLLKKERRFTWTEQCQRAFDNLKLVLSCSPVLLAPDVRKPFELMVDASDQTMGAVLMQKGKDGGRQPVAYFSKKFLSYQKNYSTVEKEALSLLSALLHFEVYLRHPIHSVVVHTDHNPLVFLQTTKGKNQRLLRWSLALQGFPVTIVHVSGRENVLADALSRC